VGYHRDTFTGGGLHSRCSPSLQHTARHYITLRTEIQHAVTPWRCHPLHCTAYRDSRGWQPCSSPWQARWFAFTSKPLVRVCVETGQKWNHLSVILQDNYSNSMLGFGVYRQQWGGSLIFTGKVSLVHGPYRHWVGMGASEMKTWQHPTHHFNWHTCIWHTNMRKIIQDRAITRQGPPLRCVWVYYMMPR